MTSGELFVGGAFTKSTTSASKLTPAICSASGFFEASLSLNFDRVVLTLPLGDAGPLGTACGTVTCGAVEYVDVLFWLALMRLRILFPACPLDSDDWFKDGGGGSILFEL